MLPEPVNADRDPLLARIDRFMARATGFTLRLCHIRPAERAAPDPHTLLGRIDRRVDRTTGFTVRLCFIGALAGLGTAAAVPPTQWLLSRSAHQTRLTEPLPDRAHRARRFQCRKYDGIAVETDDTGTKNKIWCTFSLGFVNLRYRPNVIETDYARPPETSGPPEYLAPSRITGMWFPVLDVNHDINPDRDVRPQEPVPVPEIAGRCEVRVPAQKLADALRLLFEQCPGHQWGFLMDEVDMDVSHAVSGHQLTVDDALDQMLPPGFRHVWIHHIVSIGPATRNSTRGSHSAATGAAGMRR